jgi:hypothetical protein
MEPPDQAGKGWNRRRGNVYKWQAHKVRIPCFGKHNDCDEERQRNSGVHQLEDPVFPAARSSLENRVFAEGMEIPLHGLLTLPLMTWCGHDNLLSAVLPAFGTGPTSENAIYRVRLWDVF